MTRKRYAVGASGKVNPAFVKAFNATLDKHRDTMESMTRKITVEVEVVMTAEATVRGKGHSPKSRAWSWGDPAVRAQTKCVGALEQLFRRWGGTLRWASAPGGQGDVVYQFTRRVRS